MLMLLIAVMFTLVKLCVLVTLGLYKQSKIKTIISHISNNLVYNTSTVPMKYLFYKPFEENNCPFISRAERSAAREIIGQLFFEKGL